MSDCARLGKLFGGCRFRPRYDEQQATDAIVWMMTDTRGQLMPRPARKTYICDVCETCGKTLFRRKPEEAK